MRIALTVGGSDSSGGAGIQADLKTFAACQVYGVSAITAVTAQNSTGITDVTALSGDLVAAQIEAVAGDMPIHASKTGMLATAAIVEAVAAAIEELQLPFLVVDPVLVSASGTRLLDDDGFAAMRTELIPLARVVTPNIPEAEALSGSRIASLDDCRDAARKIHESGAAAVIVTGGHRAGREVVDLLFDGRSFIEHRTPRVDAPLTHGTGCAFASAVAAGLAQGQDLSTAAANAQEYVAGAIRHGFTLGGGRLVLNHFWQIDAEESRSG